MSETVSATVTIRNKCGLHARPAALIAGKCAEFNSVVNLIAGGLSVHARNVLSIMMLAAGCGKELTLQATGEDADKALAALVKLVEDNFYEE
jgi:phosphotransferase system HPr (HPr) family protein